MKNKENLIIEEISNEFIKEETKLNEESNILQNELNYLNRKQQELEKTFKSTIEMYLFLMKQKNEVPKKEISEDFFTDFQNNISNFKSKLFPKPEFNNTLEKLSPVINFEKNMKNDKTSSSAEEKNIKKSFDFKKTLSTRRTSNKFIYIESMKEAKEKILSWSKKLKDFSENLNKLAFKN